MDKKCSKCEEVKGVEKFQVRSASKDGLTAACKSCLSARDKGRDSPERRAIRYAYAKTERGMEARSRGRKAWEVRNKDKRACHIIAGNAMRDGRLVKQPCEECGSTIQIEAHHEDYDKPLEVRWLCVRCHSTYHKTIKGEQNERSLRPKKTVCC